MARRLRYTFEKIQAAHNRIVEANGRYVAEPAGPRRDQLFRRYIEQEAKFAAWLLKLKGEI